MKDRLQQLKEIRVADNEDEDEDLDMEEISINMEQPDRFMEAFFNQVNELREEIGGVEADVYDVSKKHSIILSNPVNDEKAKEEVETLMGDIKKKVKRIRTRLMTMEQKLSQDEQSGHVTADLRIRRNQHSTLSRKFVEVLAEYNSIQVNYRDRCKARICRQLDISVASTLSFLAGRHVDEEELEDMIESGNPQIFTQGIITDAEDAKKMLADIEARHEDILKLEKSMRELHEMFMDMAMLVESQGEMIDRIEFNVEHAAEYVDRAVSDTKKALQYQSKARRKMIIIVVLVSVIIGIIILSVTMHFK